MGKHPTDQRTPTRSKCPMLRLKAERLRQGLTQAELSRAARMTEADVSRVESGRTRPYAAWLERLAAALGVCDPASLMDPVELAIMNQEDGTLPRTVASAAAG